MDQEEEAVRRASMDPDRLLPGEDPEHAEPGDAQHWALVYAELLQTKTQLIANLRELMKGQSQPARDELERMDVRMLELQIDRFRRRLAYWQSQKDSPPAKG